MKRSRPFNAFLRTQERKDSGNMAGSMSVLLLEPASPQPGTQVRRRCSAGASRASQPPPQAGALFWSLRGSNARLNEEWFGTTLLHE